MTEAWEAYKILAMETKNPHTITIQEWDAADPNQKTRWCLDSDGPTLDDHGLEVLAQRRAEAAKKEREEANKSKGVYAFFVGPARDLSRKAGFDSRLWVGKNKITLDHDDGRITSIMFGPDNGRLKVVGELLGQTPAMQIPNQVLPHVEQVLEWISNLPGDKCRRR